MPGLARHGGGDQRRRRSPRALTPGDRSRARPIASSGRVPDRVGSCGATGTPPRPRSWSSASPRPARPLASGCWAARRATPRRSQPLCAQVRRSWSSWPLRCSRWSYRHAGALRFPGSTSVRLSAIRLRMAVGQGSGTAIRLRIAVRRGSGTAIRLRMAVGLVRFGVAARLRADLVCITGDLGVHQRRTRGAPEADTPGMGGGHVGDSVWCCGAAGRY